MNTKVNKFVGALLLASSLLVSLSAYAMSDASSLKLDTYLETLEKNNKAMLSVALRKDGKLVYTKQIGHADVSLKQKADENTQYRIGSISKVFAATIAMQLVDEGKLKLSTKLAKFFPKVRNADKITVEHLLGHRSGIFNITNDPAFTSYMTSKQTREEMLTRIRALKSDFEPGSQYAYSNSNYLLLGYIIEEVTKSSFAEEVNKRIAKKLALKRTGYGKQISATDNQAFSYRFDGSTWVKAEETDMSVPHAAGAIVSTPAELTQFLLGLFEGKLVSKESLASMMAIKDGYGKGLVTFPFGQKKAYGHGGAIDAFVSNAAYFPEEKLALAVVGNGVNYEFNDVMIALLSAYFDLPFDVPDFSQKPVKLTVDKMKPFEGVFGAAGFPLDITIKLDGEVLTGQATGQGAFPLTAYSDVEFRFDQAGIIMKFIDDNGKRNTDGFLFSQGGQKIMFKRK